MVVEIIVTKLFLDDFEVPVPVGFSQLLAGTWVKERKPSDVDEKYNRKVIKEGGNFVTILTRNERR